MSGAIKSIADKRRELKKLTDLMVQQGERVAYFSIVYWVTTVRCQWMEDAIKNVNHPSHQRYSHLKLSTIQDIVVRFGHRFIDRYIAYQNGQLNKDNPWIVLFQNSDRLSATTLIWLGAFTHIRYDLPRVLNTRVESGGYLFPSDDLHHRKTYFQLNRIFTKDLTRKVIRVLSMERKFAQSGDPDRLGLIRWLRFGSIRMLSFEFVWAALCLLRGRAQRDSLRIRRGELDPVELKRNIFNANQRFVRLLADRPAGGAVMNSRVDTG